MSESVDDQTTEPPQSLPGIIRYAGPGLVVTGAWTIYAKFISYFGV